MIPGHRGLGGKAFSQSVSRHSSALAETLPPGSPLLKGCLITPGRFWRLKESCFQGHYTSVLPAHPRLPCAHLVLLRHETAKANRGMHPRRTEGWAAHRVGRSGSLRQGVLGCVLCLPSLPQPSDAPCLSGQSLFRLCFKASLKAVGDSV